MNSNLKSIVETILFISGEPITQKRIEALASAGAKDVARVLEEIKHDCAGRGWVLIENNQTYQFGTNPQNAAYVEACLKEVRSANLSRASLEVLSIIAYKGPLARAAIEYIRGVNSTFILRALLMRGLIERTENPKDSRSPLYRIGIDFLKHLGVTSIEELPEYENVRTHMQNKQQT